MINRRSKKWVLRFLFLTAVWVCWIPLSADKLPDITTKVTPDCYFEGSKIVFEIKNLASNRLKWNFGDGGVMNGGRIVNHVYKSRGFFKITVEDMDDIYHELIEKKITILKEGREVLVEGGPFIIGMPVKMRARKFIEPLVQWDFGDGTVQNLSWGVDHAYSKGGMYTVTVTDYAGRDVKSFTAQVRVAPDNRKIVIPNEIIQGEAAEFSLKNVPGGSFQFVWKFPGITPTTGLKVNVDGFKNAGLVNVVVEEKNNHLPPLTASFNVKPDDRKLTASMIIALPGEEVRFKANRFRGSVVWDLGDRTRQEAGKAEVTHAFTQPGRYTISARDFNGKSKREFKVNLDVMELTPSFNVNLLELAFNNGKYYRVAPIKGPPPAYYLRIKASGRGILKGRWLLDNQPFALFQVILKDGNITELRGTDTARLPLKDTGDHDLTLEFTNYNFNKQVPVLRYFVTETSAIDIDTPVPGSKVTDTTAADATAGAKGKEGVRLKWSFKEKFGEPDYRILITQTPIEYLTPEQKEWRNVGKSQWFFLERTELNSGQWTYWQVQALDGTGKVITTSEIASFKLSAVGDTK